MNPIDESRWVKLSVSYIKIIFLDMILFDLLLNNYICENEGVTYIFYSYRYNYLKEDDVKYNTLNRILKLVLTILNII